MTAPSSSAAPGAAATPFTGYQRLVLGMLAFLQFAVIIDFMLMAPLGALIMPALKIGPGQFGLAVSAYAFSAALSGLLAAGWADRYDRKRFLLFFYGGFVLGTLWCGLAQSFETLLLARVVTGLFGGVIGSVVMAIATDLFPLQMRGRVMGVIQTAFAASQVLGIPAGLYLSNHWNWQMPFLAMAAMGLLGGLFVLWRMQPVDAHLAQPPQHGPWRHLLATAAQPRHVLAFFTTALMTMGGFMLMPFSSAFVVNNLGVSLTDLPTVYLVTGVCTMVVGPLIGKAADSLGKLRVAAAGTLLSIVMVVLYTRLPPISLPVLIAINAVMFVGIFSRMIPAQALISSVPSAAQRGAFNAIGASVQQLAGGLGSVVAGHLVAMEASGRLLHFDTVGNVVVFTSLTAWVLLWRLQRQPATLAVSA